MVRIRMRIDHQFNIIDTLAFKIVRNRFAIACGTCINKNIAIADLNIYAVALTNIDIIYIKRFTIACRSTRELFALSFTTNRTGFGSLCCGRYPGMSCCRSCIGNIGICTYRTGIGCIACLITGGSNYACFIAMTFGRQLIGCISVCAL